MGLHVSDIQDMIETAIGGKKISTVVDGRRRFPIRVRYARDFRQHPEDLKRVFVANMWPWRNPPPKTQIRFGQVADISITDGPPVINTENSLPRAISDCLFERAWTRYWRLCGRGPGCFGKRTPTALWMFFSSSGQYENQIRAKKRLQILLPAVALIIFLLLYLTFQSVTESLLILLAVPFGLIGGILMQWLLGYNFSVAVWVGYIALAGVVVETGVVMLVYLNEALEKYQKTGPINEETLYRAVEEGAVLRLRPKLMTAGTSLIGLTPIMWATGTGSDVMKPIATPLVGGMVSSTALILVFLPVLFALMKQYHLKVKR